MRKLLLLIVCTIMGAQVMKAQEAYAVFNDGTLTFYYDNLASSRTGTVYKDDHSSHNYPDWGWKSSEITKAVFDASFKNYRPTRTDAWFYPMTNLESIEHLDYLDTSNSTDMKYMFAGCRKLEEIDLSHFDTRKVTNMRYMFFSCNNVKSLQFGSMFKTDNVTDMWEMFTSCHSLTTLDLSGFNTQNVIDMNMMFRFCYGLTSLDLSSFDTRNVEKMEAMFYSCPELQTIYAGPGWSTDKVEAGGTAMFYDCKNLKGGAGTTYNAEHIDASYAHIDGGSAKPGYFTSKNASAITTIDASNQAVRTVYDLSGRKLGSTPMQRGIYIVNGEKTILR